MLADQPPKASVVVTGAANGIGRSTAARLAATGWAVVGVDRDVAALEDAVGAIAGVPVAGDIRDNQVLAEARRAAEAAGELRAWVNNAGVVRLGPLHMMAPEVINETLDIDLRAVVFGTREALSSFLANGVRGAIVNVSSVHARGGFPGYGPYDAAKGGVEALTRYVCVEYGHLGIRCNAVAPGAVNTSIVPSPPPSDGPQPATAGTPGFRSIADAPGQRAPRDSRSRGLPNRRANPRHQRPCVGRRQRDFGLELRLPPGRVGGVQPGARPVGQLAASGKG